MSVFVKDGENGGSCRYRYSVVEEKSKELGFGVRHVQALLMFFCLTIGYGMRVTMSVAIVAMTDKTTPEEKGIMTFAWSKQIQDVILSSFFWGYMCMQLPGGHLAHRYGGKHLLVIGLIVNGIVALILPSASVYGGWKAVCACRVLQGLAQGSFLPSLHTLQGKWAPINERSRIHNYVYGGSQFGTVIVLTLSGFLAASTYGWPSIFYLSGIACILCGFVWFWFGAESPAVHKSISLDEKYYIQRSLGHKDVEKPKKIPWRQILTCVQVWALTIAHVGSGWVHVTLFTEVPSYLNKVMGLDMKSNGILSALPFVGMWVSGFVFSFFSDYFINKQICSLTTARKISNTIGFWGVAIGFVILSFVPRENVTLAIMMLIISAMFKSAALAGYHVNHIDIAPNFAGTLMSISNTAANSFAIMAPITAGLVLTNDTDPAQWKIVFCILSGLVFCANLVFVLFGSAKQAPWNSPDYFDTEMDEISASKFINKIEIKNNNCL